MADDRLDIAILGDLHCHLEGAKPQSSFLLVGAARRPVDFHPVESLLSLIDMASLRVDVLLVPGDLADKASPEGLSQAWDLCREVQTALGAPTLVPVLGNHDIDSRQLFNKDPFHYVRNMRPGFPFAEVATCDAFLGNGVGTMRLDSGAQLILVNSVVDHRDAESAKRGAFGLDRIRVLQEALDCMPSAPIRVCMLHHHPVLHSSPALADTDVLETGDRILEVLRQKHCGLVVHGHKHHSRLRYADTGAGRLPVMAAGSFAAMPAGGLSTITRNLFHVLRLEGVAADPPLRGRIDTWEWNMGRGWTPTTMQSSDFPYRSGFGCSLSISDLLDKLLDLSRKFPDKGFFYSDEVLAAIPDLTYITPGEFTMLADSLRSNHGLTLQEARTGYYELGRRRP